MKLLCKRRSDCSVKHMTQEIFESVHMTCREDAGSGFSQTAEFHILPWTGTKQSYYLRPSVSAKLGRGKKPSMRRPQLRQKGGERLWLNQLFLSSSHPSHFLFLPPSLTMNLLVLWDPSRSKQAVTSACSLQRKRGQNLNTDFNAMWDKDPGSPSVPLLGAFYSHCLCIFRCCPANQTPLVLRFSSPPASRCVYVHVAVSQFGIS